MKYLLIAFLSLSLVGCLPKTNEPFKITNIKEDSGPYNQVVLQTDTSAVRLLVPNSQNIKVGQYYFIEIREATSAEVKMANLRE